VIAAGPAMNFLIAFVIFFGLALGAEQSTTLRVGEIESGSPAEGTLQEKDLIVAVDGERLPDLGPRPSDEDLSDRATAIAERLNKHTCEGEPTDGCVATTPVALTVERGDKEVEVSATPTYDAEAPGIEDETELGRYRLGFAFDPSDEVSENLSLADAAGRSLDSMWFITESTMNVIVRIFDPEQREQISGVVGSYETTRQAVELDTRTALTVLAVISLSLAIINLFPFLPLDGGHIFWSLVEKVRGRPVTFATMEKAGAIGFVLILFLFFIGLSNDIDRLTGEGFDLGDR
jgi:regulator of sigma E protease